jgi:hypothetical protein
MVSRVCAVQTCPNSAALQNFEDVSSTTDVAVSYHSFPWRRSHIAEKWLQLLHIPHSVWNKKRSRLQLRVCSEHFSETNYYMYPPQAKDQNVKLLKILKTEAIPDRNLPQEDSPNSRYINLR